MRMRHTRQTGTFTLPLLQNCIIGDGNEAVVPGLWFVDTDRRANFRTKTFVFLSIRNEMPKEVVNADEFQDFWVPPPPPETTGQKIKRKIRENPFVPLGTAYCTLFLFL